MRIAYIFTTFPKLSERFFLREVQMLRSRGMDLDVYSMIGGQPIPEAGPVIHFRWLDWCLLWIELAVWLVAQPRSILRLIPKLNPFVYQSWTNYGENLLGLAFAVRHARRFRSESYRYLHASWATAPGMAVFVMKALCGIQYTLEAHAYDVFRDGGDAFLIQKLAGAEAIRSSTEATADELRRRMELHGINGVTVSCVRRGLAEIPEYRLPNYCPGRPLKVLSVGRLIEKKGYSNQLKLFASLKRQGVAFTASIIGDGPLWSQLEQKILTLGLKDSVSLKGRLDYQSVDRAYREADVFLFCGLVSDSGDRDGFPNVIGEAMSYGLPVFSTDVSGTTEGVKEGVTGYIIDGARPDDAAAKVYLTMQNLKAVSLVTLNAHRWIQEQFSVHKNVARLNRVLWTN